MAWAEVADRLLEHPTVRQFLLAFDEKEWPDVVQSTAALGIQALLAKYGPAVRVSDASMLRTLSRNIARSGCWPTSLKAVANEREDGVRPRSGNSQMVRRPSRPRRTGRSLPPSVSRPAARLSATAALQVARRRARTTPPEMGPLLRNMTMQAEASSASRHSPLAQLLKEISQKVPHEDCAPTTDAASDVQGSEWYTRLMSKLQRLNPKLPASESMPRLASSQPQLGRQQQQQQQQLRRQLQLPVENGVRAHPAIAKEGGITLGASSRQTLQSAVGSEPLLCTSIPRDASLRRLQELRLDVDTDSVTLPWTPPIPLQAAEHVEPENTSVLLSALPSRDDRRERHAVALYECDLG